MSHENHRTKTKPCPECFLEGLELSERFLQRYHARLMKLVRAGWTIHDLYLESWLRRDDLPSRRRPYQLALPRREKRQLEFGPDHIVSAAVDNPS
jgi:hypothetical protein